MSDTFHDMERLNIVFDIWIDAEEYGMLLEHIQLTEELERSIGNLFDDNSKDEKKFSSLLKLGNEDSRNGIQQCGITEFKSYPDKEILVSNNDWDPLFLAKYLRAKILEKGTDDYTKYLDDLVTYLQRKLPYLSPETTEENILQSLYFQELSACGRPGREALGFALQAFELLQKDEQKDNPSHYSLELYKLWAKYNQGIGYSHSNQHEEALSVFDEIVRRFLSPENDPLFGNETDYKDKKLWEHLLLYPTWLSKAELLELFQFSYHTLKTMKKLEEEKELRDEKVTENDKDETDLQLENIFDSHNNSLQKNRLIKEALAYRDMGRMNKAREKIETLLGVSPENPNDFFEKAKKIGKKNIKSKALGLLFDYYLMEFEQYNMEDMSFFKGPLLEQLPSNNESTLSKNRLDRTSYYQQVSRFLKILSDRLKKSEGGKRNAYFDEIKIFYEKLRDYLLPDSKDISEKNDRLNLKDLGKYDYNRYTESMDKFYRNLTSCGFFEYLEDEEKLLKILNDYERGKSLLYKFKELERKQRICQIHRISNGLGLLPSCKKCFCGSNSEAFNDVLKCCSPICCNPEKNKSVTRLVAEDYENIMARENKRFLDYLEHKSNHRVYQIPEDEDKDNRLRSFHFMGLQRWNSQTPTLTLSQGGGYLLYEQDKKGDVVLGIAIDPGFDFVDNLFHMGFTIHDIDFILLSHAHLDHIRDFEPIVSSLLDLDKHKTGKGPKKKIHAIMTWGVHGKLQHVIENNKLREFLADTYILDIDKDSKPENISFEFNEDRNEFMSIIKIINGTENISSEQKNDNHGYKYFEIKPTRAYHNDHSEKSDSYGYIINFYGNDGGNKRNNNDVGNKPAFSFGYTGDTKWDDNIPESYKDCDAVCIHLGALIESENGERNKFKHYRGPECEALIEKKQHPYLFGLLRYLKKIQENSYNDKNKLLLISEFGEELKGGIRIDFIRRLNELLKKGSESPVCLPVDIGLNVVLTSQIENKESKAKKWEKGHKVWCYGCEKFVDCSEIGYRHFSHGNNDEALFYFCNTCLKSKPENFFQSKMRLICEAGLPLEKSL